MSNMSADTNRTDPYFSAPRVGSVRLLLARGIVVGIFGAVLWVTMDERAFLITPVVALLWLVTSGPIVFSLGQALVLTGLQRWLFWEAIAVELAL